MTFSPGDMADFDDGGCTLRVQIISYSTFKRKDEDGEIKDYERVHMRVNKIFDDGENKYTIDKEFVRERPLGSELGWRLWKAVFN